MPAEGFLQRWSRLKTEPAPAGTGAGDQLHGLQGAPAAAPVPAAQPGPSVQQAHEESAAARQPTLHDVALLGADSDYSAFVARGVDKSVRRSALKKLFADPHFNVGDGLDLYMGDYNKPDPIPAAMMGALRHTQSFFAQAYPDKKAGDEDKHDGDGRASEPAVEAGLASPAAPGKAQPQVAGAPGASSTGATGAGNTTIEDKA